MSQEVTRTPEEKHKKREKTKVLSGMQALVEDLKRHKKTHLLTFMCCCVGSNRYKWVEVLMRDDAM